MRQPRRHLHRRRCRGKRRGRRRLEARGSIHGRRWPARPAAAKEGRTFFLVGRRSGTSWVESEGAAGVRLLVRLGRPRGLDGQKFEAHFVAPVLLEQTGPLDGDLDVVADLGLARKSRKARGQGLGDVLVHQLFGPVHDAEANAKGAAGADHAADPRHGLGVAAGVVERNLELKGEAVLSRVEDVRRGGDRGALVGEDLADLVKDLVVLVEGVTGRSPVPAGHGRVLVVRGDGEGSPGLALELDDDGTDVLRTAEAEQHLTADDILVGVELGRVVEDDTYRHGGQLLLLSLSSLMKRGNH